MKRYLFGFFICLQRIHVNYLWHKKCFHHWFFKKTYCLTACFNFSEKWHIGYSDIFRWNLKQTSILSLLFLIFQTSTKMAYLHQVYINFLKRHIFILLINLNSCCLMKDWFYIYFIHWFYMVRVYTKNKTAFSSSKKLLEVFI